MYLLCVAYERTNEQNGAAPRPAFAFGDAGKNVIPSVEIPYCISIYERLIFSYYWHQNEKKCIRNDIGCHDTKICSLKQSCI